MDSEQSDRSPMGRVGECKVQGLSFLLPAHHVWCLTSPLPLLLFPPLPFIVVSSPSPFLPFASLQCWLPCATTQPSHKQGLMAVVGVGQGVPVVVVDSILVLLVKRRKK